MPETSWRRYRRYLRLALTLFPSITWRKVRRKAGNRLRRSLGRLRARLLGTGISDAAFLRALDRRFPTLQAFLDHMAARTGPRFFLAPAWRDEFVAAMRACCPNAEALTISAADQVCEHTFDLLGSGPTHLGEHVEWHVDFKTGYRWDARQYYADVQPAPYPGGYDIKLPWELSRCQHFAWLGQAYWFTGDEKYAKEFVAQVLDWVVQNPPQYGVNWRCTMDVAIRAVNWLWGYHFFKASSLLTDEFLLTFFKSLLAHGCHIRNNLEWSESLTSNHYLSDIVGLVYLGILLPEFNEAERWLGFGLQELEKEMSKQVYPDGVDFEASVSYHRLVTELFLSVTLLARLNGHALSDPFMDRLEKMVDFTMYVTKPDGTVPLIGDNDNGRLHRLKVWDPPEREWVDHRYLLPIGAVLFDREDLARAAGNQWEEVIWLFGEKALVFKRASETKRLPPLHLESRAFVDAGLYIMRHDDLYIIVDVGSNGQGGNGGHAHNDTLSFELYADDGAFIVDPGNFAYTSDYRCRNHFRRTASHNTVMIDGEEITSYHPRCLFRLEDNEVPTVHRWEVGRDYVILEGTHNRYERLEDPVQHRRTIVFCKQPSFWMIRDHLVGAGRHKVDFYFHFSPLRIATLEGDQLALRTYCEGTNLILLPFNNSGLSVELDVGWVSRGYGTRRQAPVARYTATMMMPAAEIFVLFPFQGEQPSLEKVKSLAENALEWVPVNSVEV